MKKAKELIIFKYGGKVRFALRYSSDLDAMRARLKKSFLKFREEEGQPENLFLVFDEHHLQRLNDLSEAVCEFKIDGLSHIVVLIKICLMD